MARPTFVDKRLERMVVASVPMCTDATSTLLVDILAAEDFEDTEARTYWRCVEELVAERGGWIQMEHLLRRADRSMSQWESFKDGIETVMFRTDLTRNAEMLADLAARRRLIMIGRSVVSQAEDEKIPAEDIVKVTQDHLLEVRSTVPEMPLPRTLRQVMESPEERRFHWAVPGWLEFKDRVMITGREGGGKMTMLRQFSTQMCSGFHPWTGQEFEPLRGLQVDLQDGQARNEREFGIIAQRAGVAPFDHLFMESRDSGLNVVRSAADRRWLEGLIRAVRPHFVALGPIYQMVIGEDATDAVAMQLLMDFINKMRTKYDIMWLLEAHSPKAQATERRSWQPFGSQRFMAWPDAGYGIMPDTRNPQRATLRDWRGNRDLLSKVWPTKLVWGDVWPWVPVEVKHPRLRHRPKVLTVEAPEDEQDAF